MPEREPFGASGRWVRRFLRALNGVEMAGERGVSGADPAVFWGGEAGIGWGGAAELGGERGSIGRWSGVD